MTVLSLGMDRIFPIEELRKLAAIALDVSGYEPADSARIRAIPDVRTIRYYTTLGLIDRPAELRGRTAFYSRRHVEQLVAIKRLQAEGLTLADIQQKLLGLSATKLAQLAKIPSDFEQLADRLASPDAASFSPTAESSERHQVSPPDAQDEFWKRVPQRTSDRRASSSRAEVVDRSQITPVLRIRLDANTTLEVLELDSGMELEKIRRAAQPLLDELHRQRSTQSTNSNPNVVNDE